MDLQDYINQYLLRPGYQVSEMDQQEDGSLDLSIEGPDGSYQQSLMPFEVEAVQYAAENKVAF